MNCPYCNKRVYGMTGLQELQAFQKHLRKCKKKDQPSVMLSGDIVPAAESTGFLSALEIRAKSGQ